MQIPEQMMELTLRRTLMRNWIDIPNFPCKRAVDSHLCSMRAHTPKGQPINLRVCVCERMLCDMRKHEPMVANKNTCRTDCSDIKIHIVSFRVTEV